MLVHILNTPAQPAVTCSNESPSSLDHYLTTTPVCFFFEQEERGLVRWLKRTYLVVLGELELSECEFSSILYRVYCETRTQ
jgi:hypothetical protein